MLRYPRLTAMFLLGTALQGVFQALLVWGLRQAILLFSTSEGGSITTLLVASGIILVFSLLQSIGTFIAELTSVQLGHRIEIESMWRLLAKVLTLPVRYFEKSNQGDMVMGSYQDIQGLRWATEEAGRAILYSTRLASLAVVAVLISPKLAFIGFVAVPLIALPASWFGQRITLAARKRRIGLASWHDSFLQVSQGIRAVKVNRAEERILAKARDIAETLYQLVTQQARNRGLARLMLEVVSAIGLVMVLAFGGQDIAAGRLDWQSLLSLLIAVLAVYSPIVSLLQTYSTLRGAIPNIEHVQRVMAMPTALQDRSNPVSLKQGPKTIEFQNVSFAYNDQTVLKNVSAVFHRGETIGIVGPSGAGKSTFISLLLRFYENTGGKILFDGVDLRDIRYTDLMDQCSIVLQEPILFVDSVVDNIRMGRPTASMEQVIEAAKAANIHDEIMQMEKGYETMLGIGEEGRGLSVGQKQRICIAAALLKNAPILFLDEATSNLDAVSEHSVQIALEHLIEGRTTFVVTHRFSALRRADRILVLENGQVVGFGTHQELQQTCKTYQSLWSHQILDNLPMEVKASNTVQLETLP